MAADFVQVPELPEMPDIDIRAGYGQAQDIRTSYGQTQDGGKVVSDGGRVMTTYCGEPVKPGVGPGVLIGE